MKAVMISINPKWCGLIASGKKTVEVRKTKPNLETPFKVYIYCTKPSKKHRTICGCMVINDDELYRLPTGEVKYGCSLELMGGWRGQYSEDNFLNGKIIGEFICDKIRAEQEIADQLVDVGLVLQSCLSSAELLKYANGKALYSWHISDLKIYDEPKPLYDFYKPGALSEYDLDDNLCNYCVDTEHGKYRMVGTPNGPAMCEGRFCGAAYQEYLDEEFQMTRPPQSWCYVEEDNR